MAVKALAVGNSGKYTAEEVGDEREVAVTALAVGNAGTDTAEEVGDAGIGAGMVTAE